MAKASDAFKTGIFMGNLSSKRNVYVGVYDVEERNAGSMVVRFRQGHPVICLT